MDLFYVREVIVAIRKVLSSASGKFEQLILSGVPSCALNGAEDRSAQANVLLCTFVTVDTHQLCGLHFVRHFR